MTVASLVAYAVALGLAVATPGPAMVALIARSVARGTRDGLHMALGIALSDVVLGSLAMLGLAALLATYAWSLAVLKFAGAAYLVWLGIRMWRSPPAPSVAVAPSAGGSVAAGLAVGFSNPKAILFHASLMPVIIDLRLLDGPSAAVIVAIIFATTLSVMSVYAVAAGSSGHRLRISSMNRIAGGVMIGTGLTIAAR